MNENPTSLMKYIPEYIIIIVLSYIEPNSDKDTMLRFCYQTVGIKRNS